MDNRVRCDRRWDKMEVVEMESGRQKRRVDVDGGKKEEEE